MLTRIILFLNVVCKASYLRITIRFDLGGKRRVEDTLDVIYAQFA